jgi:hypothetical protein
MYYTMFQYCDVNNTGHAAGSCVRELSTFMGPGIFRGRLTPEQLDIMKTNPFVTAGVPQVKLTLFTTYMLSLHLGAR